MNEDEILGNEADPFDGLPGDKLLIVSECQMRNEMIRRFEPIREHLGAKQFVEFENRPIFGQKHKRSMRWLASGCRATGETANMAKGNFKGRHMDVLARS